VQEGIPYSVIVDACRDIVGRSLYRLIGILGDAGAGKSSFIKGMFPGLQLSNDDDIVNPRKIMQVRNPLNDIEDATTYHFDVRFQMAFMQMYEIADFVRSLLERKRRVVVEHFNLLYDALLLLWWERTRSPGRLFELLTVVTPGHVVPSDPP